MPWYSWYLCSTTHLQICPTPSDPTPLTTIYRPWCLARGSRSCMTSIPITMGWGSGYIGRHTQRHVHGISCFVLKITRAGYPSSRTHTGWSSWRGGTRIGPICDHNGTHIQREVDSGVDHKHSAPGGCFGKSSLVEFGFNLENKPYSWKGHSGHGMSMSRTLVRIDMFETCSLIYRCLLFGSRVLALCLE